MHKYWTKKQKNIKNEIFPWKIKDYSFKCRIRYVNKVFYLNNNDERGAPAVAGFKS